MIINPNPPKGAIKQTPPESVLVNARWGTSATGTTWAPFPVRWKRGVHGKEKKAVAIKGGR